MNSNLGPEHAPVIYGDGNQSRDFVYVSDVVRASALAMTAPRNSVAGRVFDIGSGTLQTVNAVYDALAKLTDYKLSPAYQPPRRNDTAAPCADIAPAQNAFYYSPEVSFLDGLSLTVDWCRSARMRGSMVTVDMAVPPSRPKSASKTRMDLTSALREAIEKQELRLDYQPILDLESDQVVGAEALLRWRRGDQELQPGAFIDIAARSGLILPIGKWTMREACTQAAVFQRAIHPNFRMAVNVSPLQLEKKTFATTIEDALAHSGVCPKWLELEITEGILMRDYAATQANLKRIKKLGVSIAVDDFGTGYANCNYLHRFPINRLKIDQSFIRPDLGKTQVLAAMVAFAKTLKIPVTAEGVETDRHLVYARSNGCDEAQGFYIGRPMSQNALIRLCRSRQPKELKPSIAAAFNQRQAPDQQQNSLQRISP
jgi:EAL domain-containing protein (putative c-di-GMP-specific phosphodiesterase class I)